MILQVKVGTMQNFAYLLWDEQTRDAAVIDPGFEVSKIMEKIKALGLRTRYILLTHLHFDHATEVRELKRLTNAKVAFNEKEKGSEIADQSIKEGDVIKLGNKEIQVIETPGHTSGGLCFFFENAIFTGDTMFTEGTFGRIDIGGNKKDLEQSIKKILGLPENTIIYPGHDYSSKPTSTIKQEKKFYKF